VRSLALKIGGLMHEVKRHSLICHRGYLTIVFRTEGKWQFRIVAPDGCILGEQKILYSPKAADAVKFWFKP
jgi:hypothetical protein